MEQQVTNISELCALMRNKFIEYGVREYVAWGIFNSDYIPIIHYFSNHGETEYNKQLLDEYQNHILGRYDREEITYKTCQQHIRAVSRVREFYVTGDIKNVHGNFHGKQRLLAKNEELLQEYIQWYMPLEQKTKEDMDWVVRRYLLWIERQGLTDALNISAHCFSGYLSSIASKYTDGSLHDIQLYLKKFHRFLREEKHLDIPYEFVLALPIVRTRKVMAPLTYDEIQRTIKQIDRSTPKGKRDYAMILLGARCGIRGIDIINLKLKNIDWRNNEIRFVQKKTARPIVLPLFPDVGEALKEYILNGRPKSESEHIFLQVVYPYHPFTRTIVLSHILTLYQKKAGIERYAHDGKGFHSFRRALGKALNEAEVSVLTTAQILGHQSPDSTKPYISVDIKHLKECSIGLSGIEVKAGGYTNE